MDDERGFTGPDADHDEQVPEQPVITADDVTVPASGRTAKRTNNVIPIGHNTKPSIVQDEFDQPQAGNAATSSAGLPATETLSTVSERVASGYLTAEKVATLRGAIRDKTITGAKIHDELVGEINRALQIQNLSTKGDKNNDPTLFGPEIKMIAALLPAEVARIMAAVFSIVRIAPSSKNSDPDLNVLAAYDDDPTSEHWGTYRSSTSHLRTVARRFSPSLSTKSFVEIIAALEDLVPSATRGENKDLLAVRNGIIDYNSGQPKFMEFTPTHIFLAKLDVDWNPAAENVVIHNDDDNTDWDIETWMADFFPGDDDMTTLLWEIIGAAVRPYVPWGKAVFFASEKGNNGKGTLVSLMRNVLGVANYASIPLADFGKDFLLEPLTRASAILVDENDVGAFVERGANFKAVITNDVITINRKYKAPIAHQHYGLMVQCLNDDPSTKDKSESIYRRQLMVKFTKSFTGAERKYIKTDYLARTDVLEYVLKRVLTMNYYELSEPQAVIDALNETKISNDPVRAFWNDIAEELVWDLQPLGYIYELYKAWLHINYPTGKALGAIKFNKAFLALLEADPTSEWECPDPDQRHRPAGRMAGPQLLTHEYNLEGWINQAAKKTDPVKRSTMSCDMYKQNYRGLVRKGTIEANIDPVGDWNLDVPTGIPDKPQD